MSSTKYTFFVLFADAALKIVLALPLYLIRGKKTVDFCFDIWYNVSAYANML